MFKFLNSILNEKNMCHFNEKLLDYESEYANNSLSQNQFISRLKEIIEEQKNFLDKLFTKIEEFNKSVHTKDICTQTENEITENNVADFSNSWKTDTDVPVREIVRKVAEDAVKQSGFVYESTSGLYYDYNSGYYYNAELGLYYDGNSGTYYYYDKEKNSFQFHSQVKFSEVTNNEISVPDTKNKNSSIPKTGKNRKFIQRRKKLKTDEESEVEEGECSDESVSSNIASDEEFDNNEKLHTDIQNENNNEIANLSNYNEISKAWPPCMRIIVKETNVKNLQIGTLFMVTYEGGTLGREGDHCILISDVNISKYHAKFQFDNKDEENKIGCYTIIDLGSRNGTFLDGKRLSNALQESEPHPVPHESEVRVGSTVLLCHIHAGRETCLDCEPGQLISTKDESRRAYNFDKKSSENHKKQLKKLKKKFGISSGFECTSSSSDYKDRAEIRRQTVGSYNDNFKTEAADVTIPIKNTNKGFKMLSKMGWNEGESLGTRKDDDVCEPILVQQRAEKVGLGYDKPVEAELDVSVKKKRDLWRKVQVRYQNLE